MSATDAPLPGEDAAGVRAGRGPAPEIIGGAIAVVVLAVIGTSILAGGGRPAVVATSPTPIASQASSEPTAAPPVDPAVVALLKELNQELAAGADALQKELDRATFRTADVATQIRQVNQRAAYGGDKVKALGGALGKDEPGGRLAAIYADIAGTASETLQASINNTAAYRIGAGSLIKQIGEIPPLQQALEDLLTAPPPSASPSPPPATSSVPPTASPTAPPPTATPSPTPSSQGSPTATPVATGPEQIVNGGFEQGVGAPWQLFVSGGAAATLAQDPAQPGSGKLSARVDISAISSAYGGISLQQAGLDLEAGGLYTIVLSARATTDRDLRIRISSVGGDSYLTRLVTVDPTWTPSSFTFTAPVTDANAVLEIELGRSDVSTWVDGVSFRSAGFTP